MERTESARSPRPVVVNVKEPNVVDNIDTTGKQIKHEPGGIIHFRCVGVKDLKTKSNLLYTLKLDDEEQYHCKAVKGKEEKFENETMQEYSLKPSTKNVIVEIKSQGLLGKDYLVEVRIPVDDLLSGYPFDAWYPLQNKEGKDDKKVQGSVHIMILYLQKGDMARQDEFTYPLHSMIDSGRLDLFAKKCDSLLSVSDLNSKKVTPLLHAASLEGKEGFVKILLEKGGNKVYGEKDADGRTALHLAAMYGRLPTLRLLLSTNGIDKLVKDNNGETALHLAAIENQSDSIIAIVKAGISVDIPNEKRDTPLFSALIASKGAPKAVETLIASGANVYAPTSEGILKIWEVAQRKDLTQSTQNRKAFMV